MKQIFLIGLLLLLAATTKIAAQTQNVDSLVKVLNTQKLTNEKILDIYLEICNIYEGNDTEKQMLYANKGLELSEKEKNNKMALNFTIAKIYAYIMKSDYDNAIIYCNKGLKLSDIEKNDKEKAKIYMNLGVIYARKDDFKTGMEYLWKALPLSEHLEDKRLYSTILSNIGSFYRSMENIEQAIYYLEQSKTIDEKLGFSLGLINIYYDLGSIYRDKNKIDKALEYQLKALELCRSVPDKETEVYVTQALALVYMDLKNYDKAEEYANECLRLAKEFGDPRQLLGAWNALSNIYLAQNRYQECEAAALKAWNIDSTNLDLGRNITFNIAKSNIFLGNKVKENYFFDRYDEIMKKYTDENYHKTMVEMETKYETEKKEARIASLEKERKLYVWLGITGALLAVSLGIVLWQKNRNAQKEKQLIAAQSIQDGELNERARLAEDLHDRLGGSLSAVKIELQNAENLQNVGDKLDQCIKEVREITHNLMPRSLRLSGLKGALEDFTAQFPNVHFHFFGEEKRIRERMEFAVYCCANELITNSLRHSGAENINVQLVQSEKFLSLTVQDDGCGFDEATVKKDIGLKNIQDRVASYNGKLDIASAPGKGTETVIELRTMS